MNWYQRVQHAKEAVAICDAREYTLPDGVKVGIAEEIQAAKSGTKIYSPECPPAAPAESRQFKTTIEVVNETTFSALARLSAEGGHIGCLNFASAKYPGGGFLSGAQAQEESLSRSSALYPCLLTAPEFYERNRENSSSIYLDMVIFSPKVPFFRNDLGNLLEKPIVASVITAPAPNAGAVLQNEPENLSKVKPAMARRAELVLSVAAAQGIDRMVLGAWGCGVFRNEPSTVARVFADLLSPEKFGRTFQKIVFAVLDRSETGAIFKAFVDVHGAAGR